jgi:hypothetical protein
MHRTGYTEIKTPERANVKDFLAQSPAFDSLVKIPYQKLNRGNKKIFEAICDPLTFIELDNEFKKIPQHQEDSFLEAKKIINLFFASYFDENDRFQYYFLQLRDECVSWQRRGETRPLI